MLAHGKFKLLDYVSRESIAQLYQLTTVSVPR